MENFIFLCSAISIYINTRRLTIAVVHTSTYYSFQYRDQYDMAYGWDIAFNKLPFKNYNIIRTQI